MLTVGMSDCSEWSRKRSGIGWKLGVWAWQKTLEWEWSVEREAAEQSSESGLFFRTWTCTRTSLVTCWKSNVSASEVLQGSVVTCLRCGGKYNTCFVAYLLQNPTVKELWKLVNICQSYASWCVYICLCRYILQLNYVLVLVYVAECMESYAHVPSWRLKLTIPHSTVSINQAEEPVSAVLTFVVFWWSLCCWGSWDSDVHFA